MIICVFCRMAFGTLFVTIHHVSTGQPILFGGELHQDGKPFKALVQSSATRGQQTEFTEGNYGSKIGFECRKPHEPQRKKANDQKIKRPRGSFYSHHPNLGPQKCSEPYKLQFPFRETTAEYLQHLEHYHFN